MMSLYMMSAEDKRIRGKKIAPFFGLENMKKLILMYKHKDIKKFYIGILFLSFERIGSASLVVKLQYVLYTAAKVKHPLNIFREKTVKLFQHEFILVTFNENK